MAQVRGRPAALEMVPVGQSPLTVVGPHLPVIGSVAFHPAERPLSRVRWRRLKVVSSRVVGGGRSSSGAKRPHVPTGGQDEGLL
jgi:hypothetical protein